MKTCFNILNKNQRSLKKYHMKPQRYHAEATNKKNKIHKTILYVKKHMTHESF